jgi:hypothetical protein
MIGKSAHAAGWGEQASFFAQPLCKLLGSLVGGWVGGKQDVHPASGKQDVDIDVTARAQEERKGYYGVADGSN